jgi:pectate lyase
MTYRTRADYDNILADSQQLTALLADDFRLCNTMWSVQGEGEWVEPCSVGSESYVQTSTAGTARSMTGIATTHQSVRVKATPSAFNGSDRWFGVMARFVDPDNYYYLTVRSNNTVSLRRLKDGAITVLDTAPVNVSLGTTYSLRLEAIGSSLRGYVNGTLLVEAKDATFASGKYGLVTYKTAASFDDFLATQP